MGGAVERGWKEIHVPAGLDGRHWAAAMVEISSSAKQKADAVFAR